MLDANPGLVVSREELRNRLWPSDTFVDFDHSLILRKVFRVEVAPAHRRNAMRRAGLP
jgi:DNA-binding winged helix-turn-helix (wHTH) protein